MIRNKVEQAALNWLCNAGKIPESELVHGGRYGEPDFIRRDGSGYEVKTLNRGYIQFERRQYNSLRRRHGQVLVFKKDSVNPHVIIPFSDLPADGGHYMGIGISITKSPSKYYTTMAFSVDEKEILEQMRGLIETRVFPQKDWACVVFQAMCAILCDLGLIEFAFADRIHPKYFLALCPYCGEENTIEGRFKLYWLVECTCCKRKFVAKRRVTKKVIADYLSL